MTSVAERSNTLCAAASSTPGDIDKANRKARAKIVIVSRELCGARLLGLCRRTVDLVATQRFDTEGSDGRLVVIA